MIEKYLYLNSDVINELRNIIIINLVSKLTDAEIDLVNKRRL